jgi:hypothetical protein
VLRFEGNFSPRRREGREGIFDFFLASRARECTGSGADGIQEIHQEGQNCKNGKKNGLGEQVE